MSPIPLISRLVDDLASAEISYCHWKSNAALDRAEQGDTDLDLLVARHQSAKFNEILFRHGFAPASRPHVEDPPGVVHYFGYDDSSDALVHVHAHYQLVLGHDRTKNYRLPIENAYLASRRSGQGVLPIPEPEFEYVVLVIRMILKYAIWDEVAWSALRGRRAGPSASEQNELELLRTEIQPHRVKSIVVDQLPYIGPELFNDAEAVARGEASLRQTLAVGRRVQAALSPHARVTASLDAGLRVWRRLAIAMRRRLGRAHRFRIEGGGAVIAIMGGDGAGKSTAIDEVGRWLSRDFDVVRVHLGKPPWSWTTYGVRATLKLMSTIRSASSPTTQQDEAHVEFRRLIWYACKARDRYREYRNARRAANRGAIVLSDRFPHPALRETDVPQIARLIPEEKSLLLRALIAIENRYHSMLALPDLAFVLLLEPEEAARRKTDEPYDYVLERSSEIWETDWSVHDVELIDASRPADQVASEIKNLIWQSLA